MLDADHRPDHVPNSCRKAVWLAAGLGLAIFACRDAPALFDPVERPPLGPTPYQLTFSADRESAPTWSADGDTVLYLVQSVTDETMRAARLARKIPADGGTSELALPLLQTITGGVSVERVAASSTGLLATFVLLPLHGKICGPAFALCQDVVGSAPELDRAVVGVHDPSSRGVRQAEFAIDYPGRRFDTSDPPPGVTGVHIVEAFPFQRLFSEDRRIPSRVSWAPEGERLVVSDGVGLIIWTPGSGEAFRIPGSEDGINPAWSPAGDWIAFERLERGTARQIECRHRVLDTVQCIERRTEYAFPRRSLAIVRPGGSLLRLLPEGTLPAWSPDGRRVYYESEGSIWSVGLDGVGAAVVPNTENSFEPAASPDGERLAVTRRDPVTGSDDIWVVAAVH